MKSKKLLSRKTRKRKNRGARGGAWQESQGNANNENWNGNEENWNIPGNMGYRNWSAPANHPRRPSGRANSNNYVYDGDEDTDEDTDDENQDYEDYQEYIEDLTYGEGQGCTSTTLQQKLDAVNIEIEKVADSYDTLIQGIANQTLGDFIERDSLEASMSAELSEWHRDARQRASQFQRISEEDLKRAFLYLLPSFDADKKYSILGEQDEDTSMHVMIRHYAYKMITALFTRSNITYAVIRYSPQYHEHQFMENLLGVLRSASRITNQYLREDWDTFLEIPMDETVYVHSGGNMPVMIAGMLCYLYDVWNTRGFQQGVYADTLLDEIRQDFDGYLMETYGRVDLFYHSLTQQMRDETFRSSIKRNTDKISDIDLLFMGPDYFVDDINTNAYMFQVNELSAYVLRKIMVSAHRDDDSSESWNAHTVMPFAGEFGDDWGRFKFSNMSGVGAHAVAGMRELHERDYYGYRQTTNRVDEVPMYLNRIKQGYRPFFDLDLSHIPSDLQNDYSNKYGECLDLSIGVKTNPLYNHKQVNYMNGDYYTLDTIIYELDSILQGPRDDKYDKRMDRYNFLVSINNDPVNALFRIMGRHIT